MKNNKIITLSSIFCVTLLFFACEKVIEPKNLPEQDPRVVLNCLMHRDSVIRLNVSSSKSIISGKDYKFLENATCVLYENDLIIDQFTNNKEGNYSSTVFARVGKKYRVKVSVSGFETVEGTSVMPDSAAVIGVERYDPVNSNYWSYSGGEFGLRYFGGNTKCIIKIKDDPAVRNYYTLEPKILLLDSAGNFIQEASNIYVTNNTASSTGDYSYGSTVEVDDGNLLSGNNLLVDLDISMSGEGVSIAYAEVHMIVSHINEDLYKYKTTLKSQINNGVSFFAEPVQVFNNIKNGMGIVGSMNSKELFLYKVPIKKQ